MRVLQERKFYPVGGEQYRTTEARVIAATHQDVGQLVEEGRFREDLYFRLKVVEIRVPALRERREDIPILAEALLARIRKETHQTVRDISPDAGEMLQSYDWLTTCANWRTRSPALPSSRAGPPSGPSTSRSGATTRGAAPASPAAKGNGPAQVGRVWEEDDEALALEDVISRHVRRVLERTEGNKSETDRLLGISRSRLQRYLDKSELEV